MSSPITNTFGSRRISCATASAMARATVSFLSFTAVVIVVSCSVGQRAGADDDLDVAVLVVGQLLEALFENVVQADATGDQRGDVHAAVGAQGDDVGGFAGVRERADYLPPGGDDLEEVELRRLLEDAYHHATPGLADHVDGELCGGLVADALEGDAGAVTAGERLDFGDGVALAGVDDPRSAD